MAKQWTQSKISDLLVLRFPAISPRMLPYLGRSSFSRSPWCSLEKDNSFGKWFWHRSVILSELSSELEKLSKVWHQQASNILLIVRYFSLYLILSNQNTALRSQKITQIYFNAVSIFPDVPSHKRSNLLLLD